MRIIAALLFVGLVAACSGMPLLYTNEWAVQVPGGETAASKVARRHGFENRGQVGNLRDIFRFVHTEITRSARLTEQMLQMQDALQQDSEVGRLVEQQVMRKRERRVYSPPADPQWESQWSLLNIGQTGSAVAGHDANVEPVWIQGITGCNSVVAIVDEGLEYTNPDLVQNYVSELGYDYINFDPDPIPEFLFESHGTRVGGEVGMTKDNGFCGVGVAYQSSITGIRLLSGFISDMQEASALGHLTDMIHIYSNSWGPPPSILGGPQPLLQIALETAVREGRDGKGSIYVFASGNSGAVGDDCAADGYINSIYTIGIGSASSDGSQAIYDERCSSKSAVIFVNDESGPSVTTTTTGGGCIDFFDGTSAAAPIASAIIALALEANPDLTWRDVQYLIAYTSNTDILIDGDWITNGAGLRVSHKFGFGAMDAEAMVTRARHWISVPEQQNDTINPDLTNGVATQSTPLAVSFQYDGSLHFLEHVVVIVTFTVDFGNRGDARIELTSPNGTTSILLDFRPFDSGPGSFTNWDFMSVHYWSEDPNGNWTLTVRYQSPLGFASVSGLSITLYGTHETPDAVQLIPAQCDAACKRGCATSGAQFCDACVNLRNAGTMECIDECPLGFTERNGYCYNASLPEPECNRTFPTSCIDAGYTGCCAEESCTGEPPTCFCDQDCYLRDDCCLDIGAICAGPCQQFEFTCANGQCISAGFECDGIPDCSDSSDENSCSGSGVIGPSPTPSYFYPFGDDAGDTRVPTVDDGSSPAVFLDQPFTFFEREETILYVNTNGVLSFRSPFIDLSPDPFPRFGSPLIAPFWDDVDITNRGTIYYRETTNTTLLDQFRDELILVSSNWESFFPTLLFIATWENVAEFAGSRIMVDTFQVVVAIDGQISFTSFRYGDIQWGIAQIGFDAGDGTHYFSLPGALTSAVVEIETMSNVEEPGVFIYRVDGPSVQGPPFDCEPSEFTCDNGHCISTSLVCNGVPDCSNGTDERNCTIPTGCVAAGSMQCCAIGPCFVPGGSCYCDLICYEFNNCCEDIAETCPLGVPGSSGSGTPDSGSGTPDSGSGTPDSGDGVGSGSGGPVPSPSPSPTPVPTGCVAAGSMQCCAIGPCFVPGGSCFCDLICYEFNDCCEDIAETCPLGVPGSSGSGTPDSGSGTPDSGSGTPDSGSGTPDSGSGTPDSGSGTPDSGSGTPDSGDGVGSGSGGPVPSPSPPTPGPVPSPSPSPTPVPTGCVAAGSMQCCAIGPCFVPGGSCFCDLICYEFNDCCEDIAETCPLGVPGSSGSGTPDSGSGTPDSGSGTPDSGSGTPDSGSGTPDSGSGTPDSGSGTPDSGSGTPDSGDGVGSGSGGPVPSPSPSPTPVIHIGFDRGLIEVNEAAGTAAVTVRVLSGAPQNTIIVLASAAEHENENRATAFEDFLPTSQVLDFDEINTGRTFEIPIINDDAYEGMDVFLVTLQLLDMAANVVFLQPSNATVVIIDDDAIVIGLTSTSVNEGQEIVVLTPQVLSGILETHITLLATTVNNTATAGLDYSDEEILILLGSESATPSNVTSIQIQIVDDDLVEMNEDFYVQLFVIDAPNLNVIISPNQSRVTIEDNDGLLVVGFSSSNYSVNEEAEEITVEVVVFSGVLDNNVHIPLDVLFVNSTADGNFDYSDFGGVVHLDLDASGQASVQIPIHEDILAEEDETFVMLLLLPPGVPVEFNPDLQHTVVTILDNDRATIGFMETEYFAAEGEGIVNISVSLLSGALGRTVSVRMYTEDNTATDTDYEAIDVTLVFDRETVSHSIAVTLTSDTAREPVETFVVQLQLLNPSVDNVDIAVGEALVYIIDDDNATIGFEMMRYLVSEAEGTVAVTISVLSGTLDDEVPIYLEVQNGSAVAPLDYEASDGLLRFNESIQSHTVFVSIINDNILERNETFVLRIASLTDQIETGPSEAMVTILDDDFVTVGIEQTSYTVLEADFLFTVNVVLLEGTLGTPVELSFSAEDGTASSDLDAPPFDYLVEQFPLIFDSSHSTLGVQIFIFDDTLVEPLENFFLQLESSMPGVIASPSRAEVFIEDEDGPAIVGFSPAEYAVSESAGSVSVNIALLSGVLDVEHNISVTVSTSSESAVDGQDFLGIPDELLSLDQSNDFSTTVTIPILEDSLTEEDETFIITMAVVNPSVIVETSPEQARITILNNDDFEIYFEDPVLTVNEGEGTLSVTVLYSAGNVDMEATVSFSTQDNEARGFLDYIPVNANLTFNQDTVRHQVPIPIIDDNLQEGDETFSVHLTAVSTSTDADITFPAQALIVIIDNDRGAPIECTSGSVRLENNITGLQGRVEVCIDGLWSSVCDNSWDTRDATVVCSQLELPSYGAIAYGGAQFGAGSGPIGLTDVECQGSEPALLACPSGGSGSDVCSHSEDAGVECFGGVTDCTCTRSIECTLDGQFLGNLADVEVAGRDLRCTIFFDRSILRPETTFIDTTFDMEFLSGGSLVFLRQLEVIPREEGFESCDVQQTLLQHGDPAIVLGDLGIESLQVTYLKDDGSYGSLLLDPLGLQQVSLEGDFATGGQLNPQNACSFQHLIYWLTTTPSLPASMCRTAGINGATSITFQVPC